MADQRPMTPAEIGKRLAAIKEQFSNADRNGDGNLNRSEMSFVLKQLNPKFSIPKCNKLFDQIDKDKSNTVSLDEFIRYIAPPEAVEELIAAEIQASSSKNAPQKADLDMTGPKLLKDSYSEIDGTIFADVLRRRCIAVVKASYFESCFDKGVPFEDRANIPEEAFFSGPEVLELWKTYGFNFLAIVSYAWISAEHPDPDMFHLERIVRILQELRKYSSQVGGAPEFGIILDFCSLWQRRGETETRSPEQLEDFKEGIKSINTPYGHQKVMAIKMMAVPDHVLRKYDDRGWTLFESNIINGKEPADDDSQTGMLKLSTLNIITFDNKDYNPLTEKATGLKFIAKFADTCHCDPPLTPARFAEEMETRRLQSVQKGVPLFTDGKDKPFILSKFRDSYELLIQAEALRFMGLDWRDGELKELCNVLPDMNCLKELNLANNHIGDEGVAALIKTLGDEGQKRSRLKLLDVHGNPISDHMKDNLQKAQLAQRLVC
jgi:hypothetical protein